MRLGFALLAILLMVAAGNVLAADTGVQSFQLMNPNGLVDKVHELNAPFTQTRTDTVYLGGDDGNGIAFAGGIWDFDTIVTDPLQGFTSIDKTANLGDYFARVEAADFADDPCAPIFTGSLGQLYCGIHEDEANLRDFIGGMGYQDNMCQNAFSPIFDYAGESLDIAFTYFNDTEVDYDYTYVYIACFDAAGVPLEAEDAEFQVDLFTGIIASYETPAAYLGHVDAGLLPVATEKVKLQLRMWADGGYSDEDGNWDSVCGPFACDDLTFTIGATPTVYDFEADEQGWTFGRCPGIGAFMGIAEAADYELWLDEVGLLCDCALNGNALECVDEDNSPFSPPGHPRGHDEELSTGPVPRGTYQPPEYNTVLCFYTDFLLLTLDRGTFYRPGYKTYPYTTEVNPIPHWSPRKGQNTWHYAGDNAVCQESGYNMSTIGGNAGDPMPVDWDSCKFVYECTCSAAAFGLEPTPDEGNTLGTPVIDDMQIALTGAANAPVIAYNDTGHGLMDGFGQMFPAYLEPSDRCNVNITRDWSPSNDSEENDWLGDSVVIAGPAVSPSDPLTQWQVEMCFKITNVGARQQMVPEYHAWKARLNGDPEVDFVCVLMDSLENGSTIYNSKFSSYFHEDEAGFDVASGDLSPENEILPDGIFTPGTSFEYYYSATWTNIPDGEAYVFPPFHAEFALLPQMRLSGDTDYSVEWPSFLYVDAFNRGVEYYVNPTLAQMGIEADKYDYLDCSSNWKGPLKRSFSATGPYNPGGYGNNGCTIEQLLGYRMIFVNTGTFTGGAMEKFDWTLFTGWLNATDCDFPNIRRGIVFDGDEVVGAMLHTEHQPEGQDFLNQVLGATQLAPNYREFVDDWEYCVYLSGLGAAFDPLDDTSVYGNGCPNTYNYNVLGLQGGVGAQGNLAYYNDGIGETEFAQVVRSNTDYPYNWRSILNGFSVHHLSWVGCEGDDCASDSSCVVNAAANVLMPSIDWILDGADPFDPWLYPCNDTAVEDDNITHSNLKVNFLRGASPNPFRNTATIRFSLAQEGNVDFAIYDVSGRLVKSLGEDMFEAGDNAIVWDGTDNGGNRVSGGIFWMQMNTDDGFSSGKKMIVLR
jgi:flagellar hook capping protein FlgD